jgi:hypothetical protein
VAPIYGAPLVDIFTVPHRNNINQHLIVLDETDDSIVSNTITPKTSELARERLT